MPDRVLPGHVEKWLSDALESGAPLTTPLPSQARYSGVRAGSLPAPRWRARVLTMAVAAAGIVAITFAAPPQQRSWIVQGVGHIAHDVGVPATEAGPSPGRHESTNEPTESPEAHESPEPAQSPEAGESPVPSPSGGGDHPQPSPTSTDGDGGHDGGGDTSPQPSPSSGD